MLKGNKGHTSITISNSTNNLIVNVQDLTGSHHAPGISGTSCGNVFWKVLWRDDTSYEAHGGQPYANLFDQCQGGFMYGRWGGALKVQPNHLEKLIFWNFKHIGKPQKNFKFWRKKSKWGRILPPIIVGFHGSKIQFDTSQIEYLESLGRPVYPCSLYRAQFDFRISQKHNE